MTIKAYKPNMQPDIVAFYAECFQALGWDYDPQGEHADTVHIAEEYLETGQFWCLYDCGALVGTVALRAIGRGEQIAELKRLYVLPAWQGKGLGGLLFDTAFQYAKRSGFKTIYADTRNDRLASRHLLCSYGFHEITQYNDNAFAELFYALDL